ncbi:hypothetical protein T484DRAFT_3329868 [Baffinella frigidus]|nr:hypothetical protein T484DRAFT_3329868 [Cryptophyta sp. CCMP2293]
MAIRLFANCFRNGSSGGGIPADAVVAAVNGAAEFLHTPSAVSGGSEDGIFWVMAALGTLVHENPSAHAVAVGLQVTASTLNLQPETRNPKPETRNPKPETRNPKHETLNLNPQPSTLNLNPKPQTPNPKPQTPNPKPRSTLNPEP